LKTVRIGRRKIGDQYPTFVIAEMAWAHDGSVENAKKIIDAAANARADAVCFHLTSMKNYMVPQYRTGKGRVSAGKEALPIYAYLSRINLTPAAWAELFPYARKNGLLICAMCNDLPSVGLAFNLKADAYVVSPASLAEENLVRCVAKKGKPVFLRVGGATMEEVERIPTLKQKFQVPIGFADHTDGGSDLALVIPLVALAFGANVIEKHLTHDRSLRGEDFESALDPPVFKKFVVNLRKIEEAFGFPDVRSLSKAEREYREIARKRTVAARDIEKGEKITRDKLAFKRSDEGIFSDEIERVLGKTVLKRINKNDPITPEKVR